MEQHGYITMSKHNIPLSITKGLNKVYLVLVNKVKN